MKVTEYARVTWRVEDILDLREDMTEAEAAQFLNDNQKHIQEAMVQAGRDVIETLLTTGKTEPIDWSIQNDQPGPHHRPSRSDACCECGSDWPCSLATEDG